MLHHLTVADGTNGFNFCQIMKHTIKMQKKLHHVGSHPTLAQYKCGIDTVLVTKTLNLCAVPQSLTKNDITKIINNNTGQQNLTFFCPTRKNI
jgi:hypothetical protein